MATNNGKTVLITGATRGLGLALARGLAARGWNLILTGRDSERLRSVRDELAAITHVAALAGDVTIASHRQALAVLARGHGGLDALINNAGALGPSPLPSLSALPTAELEDLLRTNVIAPLALIQAVGAAFKPDARIINVTSDAAVNAYAGWGAYGASKAALERISAVLAVERSDVRIYWIDPGDMWTDMHQAAYPGEDISDRPQPSVRVPAFVALLESDHASGRFVAADLVPAALVA